MCLKVHAWEMIINGDILVKKLQVEKSNFKVHNLSFHYFFINVNTTYISKESFTLVI